MAQGHIEEILVLTEEEENTPLFVSPRSRSTVQVRQTYYERNELFRYRVGHLLYHLDRNQSNGRSRSKLLFFGAFLEDEFIPVSLMTVARSYWSLTSLNIVTSTNFHGYCKQSVY